MDAAADPIDHENSLARSFLRAAQIMHRLRAPGGCPWDREQTFDSLRRYTIEEGYEVLDAVERKDWPALKDELGDLLLQVLFYAELAQECGHFTLDDVLENLSAKLVRRHPHVFGGAENADTAEAVLANWEQIKQQERAERGLHSATSRLDAVARNLPALMEAAKLGSSAAAVGFDWTSATPVFAKLQEEITELKVAVDAESVEQQESELGDVLFTVVNLARKLNLQAEFALRSSNLKFRRRFAVVESLTSGTPIEALSPDELEALWMRAKQQENVAVP